MVTEQEAAVVSDWEVFESQASEGMAEREWRLTFAGEAALRASAPAWLALLELLESLTDLDRDVAGKIVSLASDIRYHAFNVAGDVSEALRTMRVCPETSEVEDRERMLQAIVARARLAADEEEAIADRLFATRTHLAIKAAEKRLYSELDRRDAMRVRASSRQTNNPASDTPMVAEAER